MNTFILYTLAFSQEELYDRFYDPPTGLNFRSAIDKILEKHPSNSFVIPVNWVHFSKDGSVMEYKSLMDKVNENFKRNNVPIVFDLPMNATNSANVTHITDNYETDVYNNGNAGDLIFQKYGIDKRSVLNIFSGAWNMSFAPIITSKADSVFLDALNEKSAIPVTLTHEIGHWLGLAHTFQGTGCNDLNNDYVKDTPVIDIAANGEGKRRNLDCTAVLDTCNPKKGPELLNNFMDYTNAQCQTSFTMGQSFRMANFAYYRLNNKLHTLVDSSFRIDCPEKDQLPHKLTQLEKQMN